MIEETRGKQEETARGQGQSRGSERSAGPRKPIDPEGPSDPERSADPEGSSDPERSAGRAAPERPSIDTFIFDLDGTLLDTLPDLVALTNATLRARGYPEHTTDEVRSYVGDGAAMLIRRAVPEGTPSADVDATMYEWRELYPIIGMDLTKPFPHMVEALHELKSRGVRLGVLSNKFDKGVQDVIGKFLPGLFDVAHGECEYIPRKPDPAGLLYTMRELGAVPERTAYVGDACSDLVVARAAGVTALGAAWGYTGAEGLRAVDGDGVLTDPLELVGLVGPARA